MPNFTTIPPVWTDILKSIQMGFPEAVMAGGCLRDFFLNRTVADLDIFVSHPSDVTDEGMDTLVKGCKLFSVSKKDTSNLAVYQLNFSEISGVWDAMWNYHSVQIIALKETISPWRVLNRIDFGICKIAWDGVTLFIHGDFLLDVEHKTFTLIRCVDVHAHRMRWERLKLKYPDYTLIAPEIHALIEHERRNLDPIDF